VPFPLHSRHCLPNSVLLDVGLLLFLSAPSYGANMPRVVNGTNAVVVERVDHSHSGFRLTLRSTSPVAVYGMAIAVVAKNGVCDLHIFKALWGSFMSPMGVREVGPLSVPRSRKNGIGPRVGSCSDTGAGKSKLDGSDSPVIPRIVIEAANFEDGTSQGNRVESALLEANRLGRNSQYLQINAIVENELNGEHSEDPGWVGVLLAKVSALSETPDPQAVQSVESRFSPAVTRQCVQQEMQLGLMWVKLFFTNNLKVYAAVSSKEGLALVSLRTWWNSTKGACDYFSPHCRDGSWRKSYTTSQQSPD
jgi:hypothetical protein